MGLSASRIIPYKDAVNRLEPGELDQLQDAFNRFTRTDKLPKDVVLRYILGDLIPTQYAEGFYQAFEGTEEGLTFQNLVIAMVIFLRGTKLERAKLMFAILDAEKAGFLLKRDFDLALLAGHETVLPQSLQSFFSRKHQMSFEEFNDWVTANPTAISIAEWVNTTPMKPLPKKSVPTFFELIAEMTSFTEEEVISLEKRYYYVTSFESSGRMTPKALKRFMYPQLPVSLITRICELWDTNVDGSVDFREFVVAVGEFFKGDSIAALFNLFDMDRDGKLDKNDLLCMLHVLRELKDPEASDTDGLLQQQQSMVSDASTTNDDKFVLLDKPMTSHRDNASPHTVSPYAGCSLTPSSDPSDLAKVDAMLALNSTSPTPSSDQSWDTARFLTWATNSHALDELEKKLMQAFYFTFAFKPPTPEEEGELIHQRVQVEKKLGITHDTMYIVSSTWLDDWKAYTRYPARTMTATASSPSSSIAGALNNTGNTSSPAPSQRASVASATSLPPRAPGPIDNQPLIHTSFFEKQFFSKWGSKLRRNLQLRTDYEILLPSVWAILHHWYGGGPAFPRPFIAATGTVELYPVALRIMKLVAKSKDTSHQEAKPGLMGSPSSAHPSASSAAKPNVMFAFTMECSRAQPLKDVIAYICTQANQLVKGKLSPDAVRLWNWPKEGTPSLFEDDDKTVEELKLYDNQQLLAEVRNPDLTWPSEMFALSFKGKASAIEPHAAAVAVREPGTTGLSNLGNTCFMNSSLQCLSNTIPLTQYFRASCFLNEINKDNVLGTKGVLAEQYARLINQLWSGRACFAPVKMRASICKYASQFDGRQQHDSQELLAFLLDGLHEDLNRITHKPYVERADSNGRPDPEVALQDWENHCKRNQSIIVDLFHGQLRSQLRCLECQCTSVTFDPFTFLSLPLPTDFGSILEVTITRLNGSPPVKYQISTDEDVTYRLLKRKLSELSGISADRLIFMEVAYGTVMRVVAETFKVRALSGSALTAYEVDDAIELPPLSPTSNRPFLSNTAGASQPTQSQSKFTFPETSETNDAASTSGRPSIDAQTAMEHSGHPAPNQPVIATPVPVTPAAGAPSPNSPASSITPSFNTYAVTNHLFGLHRRMSRQDAHFLTAPCRPLIFGTPLLIPYIPKATTHKQLYERVWTQVARFVVPEYRQKVDQGLEKYPFILKRTMYNGITCSQCKWNKFCFGCPILSGPNVFEGASTTVAIEWDPRVLHLHYIRDEEVKLLEHESCQRDQSSNVPLDLDACLRAFTKEEQLGEGEHWYCPRCKKHQRAAKKLDIWALPPFLVIHLKRFQSINGAWRKSNRPVHFPLNDFDPARVCREADLEEEQATEKASFHADNAETTAQHAPDSDGRNMESSHANNVTASTVEPAAVIAESTQPSNKSALAPSLENEKEPLQTRVTRSHSLIGTEHYVDPHQKFYKSQSSSHKYDLYAMSSHLGIMGGGHYIAYAHNPNGKWYFYNDSSCKETTPAAVESESAYMLFYQARDIDLSKFLPEGAVVSTAQPEIEDDEEPDQKSDHFCTIA